MKRAVSKIVDPGRAAAQVERWRRDGERIVLASGVFDLLRAGHVRDLEAAAALGTRLVVGVNDDASARALQGPGRPVVAAAERARLVAALRVVDLVVEVEANAADRLRAELAPHVLATGRTAQPRSGAAATGAGSETAMAGGPEAPDLIERIRASGPTSS